MEIKSVLVPTDFSLPSRLAVNYGVSVARKFRSRLTLAHVLEPASRRSHGKSTTGAKKGTQRREEAIRELWAVLAPEDQDDLDLRVVLKEGSADKEIAAIVEQERPDVVILGTHGHGRIGRLIIGSTTEHLLRTLTVPMLTVSNVVRPMAFERILFATDLSEAAHHGFTFALDLARTLQAELVVLHCMEVPPGKGDSAAQARDMALEEARRKLGRLAAEGKFHNVKIQTILTEGMPGGQILKAADESMADFILMGVKSKNVVERALVGTTAAHVVREARVPVLAVPVHQAAHPEAEPRSR